MTYGSSNKAYLADLVATASPQRLLVMLYDRLLLDLDRGVVALDSGERERAHDCLVHAQEIIFELQNTLDLDAWPAAQSLDAIYDYVLRLLVEANLRKITAPIDEAKSLLAPLRDAWREIAGLGVNAA